MTEFKPIPIGYEDFKEIIDKECYYVDKTLMIKELIDSRSKINLYTRPRRFGKTLNISMLQRFYEKTEESNAYLFDGLNISKAGEKYMSHQGQYPVITLSLKSMKQASYENAFALFKKTIADEFERHDNILNSDKLSESRKTEYKLIKDKNSDNTSYLYAIRFLSDCLYVVYGKNVVILIDEYDVPLHAAYSFGFYDEMVNLIRSVFESALKTNPYLELGVLTGCLRVSKESIFTGLNNLKVHSVIDNKFVEYFGFTETEVKKITDDYNASEHFDEIKQWYDGYVFGKAEIYNPWSVLNYIDSDFDARAYWSNTSSNDIIHDMIVDGSRETHELIEKLASGEKITKPIYEDITYRNIDVKNETIWSFLLYTGYLKATRIFKDDDNLLYADMTIPNVEIQTIYRLTIMGWTKEKINAESRNDLMDSVVNGDVKQFEKQLMLWLRKTISYHDEKEMFYHGFVTGLLTGFEDYEIKSNRESGNGRPDILVLERFYHELAVVIEIKAADKFGNMEKYCDIALQQINDKNYEEELKSDSYQKVIKYGISFYDKSCKVKMAE